MLKIRPNVTEEKIPGWLPLSRVKKIKMALLAYYFFSKKMFLSCYDDRSAQTELLQLLLAFVFICFTCLYTFGGETGLKCIVSDQRRACPYICRTTCLTGLCLHCDLICSLVPLACNLISILYELYVCDSVGLNYYDIKPGNWSYTIHLMHYSSTFNLNLINLWLIFFSKTHTFHLTTPTFDTNIKW